MKKAITLSLFFCFLTGLQAQDFTVFGLTCEHRTDPVGLDVATPRFSWKTQTGRRGWRQSAWQIQSATGSDFSAGALVWDSGKIISDNSVLQVYRGSALRSGTRYFWRVKVWDEAGKESAWSAPSFWETALLSAGDWKASWVEPEQEAQPPRFSPAHLLRKEFVVNKKIASARAYATARGLYELHLNGRKIGDQSLTPGWTVYYKRIQYQTFDLTGLMREGVNTVGAMLGEGWYRSGLGWEKNWAFYGKKLAFLCQIHLRYTDGTEEWVVTDGSWKTTNEGPVKANEIYYGEDYDARLEQSGWNQPGFDDSRWRAVLAADYPKSNLVAAASVPVRPIEEIKPLRIFRTPAGELVADMGQNMVGWIRLRVKGKKGRTVTLRHAEVLDKAGNFYTANLRAAKQRIRYTLRGDKNGEVYEPHFTFMGFRYVAIDGYHGDLKPEAITGVVVHSDMAPSGSFECSSPLINQLQHNILWGQKGNFVDVPTDCPQRDERMGWTGDAQVFARTAAFNMDVAAFFDKWLRDVAAEQRPGGAVPFVVPDVLDRPDSIKVGVSAGWGDAAVIIPWTMYQVYDDRQMLERQYPSMKAYVDYIRNKSGDSLIWRGGSVFGDWLFYHPSADNLNYHVAADAHTNHDFISTAFFAHGADIVSRAAAVLGKTEEAAVYKDLFEKIKAVFVNEFITPAGRTISSASQTSYVLALHFGLMPEHLRPAAVKLLVKDIRDKKKHLSTGFLGTPYLCHVLSENGETELAYDLLFQETYPSWLYPVKMGATTIWERWDGQKTDSTFQNPGMNSFNHYAYGAIGDWMYQVVAGLRLGTAGYKHIRIQPHLSDKLTYAKASYTSSYGEISSGWERNGNKITLRVAIPPNTSATIRLPRADASGAREGGRPLSEVQALKVTFANEKWVETEVGSGVYSFEWALKPQ
ncbi:MAG: family 78 glycoside hydrolase catalytic domain [Lewinellaceae bacterium]|nr:family 78 glycoside hydrolase catalytic domain [Lewinellaceae bacterium]